MEEHEIANAREWQLEGEGVQPRPTGSAPPGVINGGHSQMVGRAQIEAMNNPRGEDIPNARTRKNSEIAARQKTSSPARPRGRGQQFRGGRSTRGHAFPTNPRFTPVWARRPSIHNTANRKPAGATQTGGRFNRGLNTSPGKAAVRTIEPFQLPTTFGQIANAFSNENKSSTFTDAIENIKKTGASVLPPRLHNRTILIRGTPDEREAAQGILKKIVFAYSSRSISDSQKEKKGFAKISSYFQYKETHIGRLEKQDDILRNLRQPLDPSTKFTQTLLFLWPEDELPMKESLGQNLEDLDPIRREFQYPIYVYRDGESSEYIRVDGYDQDIMRVIVQRLRTKWAELMASVNVKAKLYLAQPPSPDAMRTEVDIMKLSQRGGGFAYASASLYGISLGGIQLQQWSEKSRLIKMKNDVRLRDTIERSLLGLRFLRGHVRMRVNLGAFVLDSYRNPTGSKPRHSFVEFRQMLLHDKTKGHLIPGLVSGKGDENLVVKCANASDLLAPFEATALSLDTIEPIYAVNFEFLSENDALLRLEVEFIRYPGSKQFEVAQRRWVKPQGADRTGDKRAPLQVGVIDFERADWQLEIKALEFQKASTINQALDAFAHSVRFKSEAAEGGLKAEARRKVEFSNAVPVSRLIEKSALRYRVKGTNYTLELSRYDEYRHVGMQVLQGRPVQPPDQLSTVPVTSWGASIFDMNWDNVLGEHANYGMGRAADWRPNLNTFFPTRGDPNPVNIRAGFSEFLHSVTKISELLHPKPAKDGPKTSVDGKPATTHPTEKQVDGQKPEGKTQWADILIDSGAIF